MFVELRERFSALREFHSVHGLTWGFPEDAWRITRWIWLSGVIQVLFHALVPSMRHQPFLTEIAIQLRVCLFFTVTLCLLCTFRNAWRNLPSIIAFLRDPTFETNKSRFRAPLRCRFEKF